MPNEDLLKPLKAINQTIARLREDVQKLTGEVEKIKTAVTEAAQSIRDAIHENIQAQAELKLMEYVMEVKSVKPQIEAEHEQIRTERSELDERLQAINDRYAEKHRDLDETAQERIRNLGSHIFEIDEEQFEEGIERPFTKQVTTSWQVLQGHNAAVGEERSTAVRETTSETVQTIHDYIDRQDQLLEQIDDHRLDPLDRSLPSEEATPLQVPYYVIEYEHDGVQTRKTIVPSRLSDGGTDWCSVSLESIPGSDELIAGAGRVSDPERKERLSREQVRDSLEEYGEQSPLGISYTDAVAETIPKEDVTVEHEVDD
ncbi:hypothetical protein [Natrinema salinisoli]|uniref:hypothetical protein n=1 Tax=Natrinema salinisoli TaxID=2878535 RepID=UPI001CF07F58|nr:hypothetical protein [Natrinema salinisoli]